MNEASPQPLCVIVGAGPGNGRAFARRFSQAGFRVALLARDASALQSIAAECAPDAVAIACDVTEPASVDTAKTQLLAQCGPPSVLIYNAGAGVFGSVDEVTAADFENAWRTNAAGLLAWTQALLPAMRERGRGNIVVIGATAAKRGGARFTAFASAKHAQYGLAQSLARKLGPEGIHVSYVVIDGVIDSARTRKMFSDRDDSFFLQAPDIAEAVFSLTQQPPSAWTFELDLRPFAENW